ncbi:MAG: FAD-dependent monooxygenase [Armatimonadota bacterium]|nr:FAD-dependent monooxygenase [Armatimonadota bacterium]MDR5696963.1 FAD-dependent monooxygenase [Armatimonadota bacterium]
MRVAIVGGGPAGLYLALLLKKADRSREITVFERNPPDATYGWGVVFSDRTLAEFREADYRTYREITDRFVLWDAIDVWVHGERVRCGGHVFAGIARTALLGILQRRCADLGVRLVFRAEVTQPSDLPPHDVLVGADGVHSIVRSWYEDAFRPTIAYGRARYVWLGTRRTLGAFTFAFRPTEWGLFQAHAYPYDGRTSTFIVECAETTWRRAGLQEADEEQTLRRCEAIFGDVLRGEPLLSNNSRWIRFPTLRAHAWHFGNVVLLGDAAHTAHFSIGSGTKLAMEDAIVLANAFEAHRDVEAALRTYEGERRPIVEAFQRAAAQSQRAFETTDRTIRLDPMRFAFHLLTRSGRISYDDLRLRDPAFVDRVDGHLARERDRLRLPPPPAHLPFTVCGLRLDNRVVLRPAAACGATDGVPASSHRDALARLASRGAGLVLTEIVAVLPEGRITPEDAGLYRPEHAAGWAAIVGAVHAEGARVGAVLGHAGRRGATRPRRFGVDVPLRQPWTLLAPSPVPYLPESPVPKEMTEADMDAVRAAYVRAARMAREAGFDLLHLHFGCGYLLASFLSPLTNRRTDAYGGTLENRLRFPLEVFAAVRGEWSGPVGVALPASDRARRGIGEADALAIAQAFRDAGCDLVEVTAGQTVSDDDPTYGPGFLVPFADAVRNGVGVAVLVAGGLASIGDVNTLVASGRADLCVLEPWD